MAGVDGSAASACAARWAADEADLRNEVLGLLFADQIPIAGRPEDEYPPQFADAVRTAGQNVLDRAADAAAGVHPDLRIRKTPREADARSALDDESTKATMTVVGRKGKTALGRGSARLGRSASHGARAFSDRGRPRIRPHHTGTSGGGSRWFTQQRCSAWLCLRRGRLAWNRVGRHGGLGRALGPARCPTACSARCCQPKRGGTAHATAVGPASRVSGRLHPKSRPPWPRSAGTTRIRAAVRASAAIDRCRQPRSRGLSGLILGSTSHTVIIHSQCPVVVVRQGAAP